MVKIPCSRWAPKTDAVLRIFPNIRAHLSKPVVSKCKRKPPKLRETANFEGHVSESGGNVSDVNMENGVVDEATHKKLADLSYRGNLYAKHE